MKEPEIVGIKAKELTVPSIEQYYMEFSDDKKFNVLCRLLDIQLPELAIVFVRTKRRVDEIAEALKNGDTRQKEYMVIYHRGCGIQ